MSMAFVWAAAGGFIGAIARYGVSQLAARRLATGVPYGTLFVNVTGSFLLGLLIGWGVPERWEEMQLLFGIGVLGAYTTFSAYAAESAEMLRRRQFAQFLGYQAASYIGSIALAAAGWALGQLLYA